MKVLQLFITQFQKRLGGVQRLPKDVRRAVKRSPIQPYGYENSEASRREAQFQRNSRLAQSQRRSPQFRFHLFRWMYFLVTGFALSLFLSGLLLISHTSWSVAAQNPLPNKDLGGTKIPDWSQISFDKLPGIGSSGSYLADPGVVSQLGYDPSRSWSAGQSPTNYLSLGDFSDSFQLQNFDIDAISQITGLNLENTSLDNFGLMQFQTLESLVKAIPTLKDVPIKDVLPVQDLITQSVGAFDAHQTLEQLLKTSPHLGELEFSNLSLDKYKLTNIPNLESTSLGSFKNWQGVMIQEVPDLEKISFSQFPHPPSSVGTVTGVVDVVFGAAEQQRTRTISGSDAQGFNVSCKDGCAHVELSGSSDVRGRQWVSGKYQEVKGGQGVLATVNNGREPVGRHPFGDAFKVVIWDISEPKGTASAAMFFRICSRNSLVDLGCTPYFLGPVPLMSYRETDPIFLGTLSESGASSSVSIPTAFAKQEMQAIVAGLSKNSSRSSNSKNTNTKIINSENSLPLKSTSSSFLAPSSSNTISSFLPPNFSCQKQYQGVTLDALASALSSIEGGYDSVGTLVCDGNSKCGRGLGAMQFMSYRDDVRAKISTKPGGEQFLASIDKGTPITGEQLLMYFPPQDQQRLFQKDAQNLIDVASQQTDPTTGKPFISDRLLERVAQMHYGGLGTPIDSSATDIHQKLSVQSYGQKVRDNYHKLLADKGC